MRKKGASIVRMTVTKTFRSGNSEAVRLPAEIAYGPGTELEVRRIGDLTTLRPVRKALSMRETFALLDAMPKPGTPEEVDRGPGRDTLDDLA